MKNKSYFIIFISLGLSYFSCDVFDNCIIEEYYIPVELYPLKDTFHVGDTLHVHIEFPVRFQDSDNENRTIVITSEYIGIKNIVGFISDTTYVIENALKNSTLIVDTSRYKVFKRHYSTGDYAISAYIDKNQGKYEINYAFTLNDTGRITTFFFYHGFDEIELEDECYIVSEGFRLQVPEGKDDNYDIYKIDNPSYLEPGHKYSDYKNTAAYTFYVVE